MHEPPYYKSATMVKSMQASSRDASEWEMIELLDVRVVSIGFTRAPHPSAMRRSKGAPPQPRAEVRRRPELEPDAHLLAEEPLVPPFPPQRRGGRGRAVQSLEEGDGRRAVEVDAHGEGGRQVEHEVDPRRQRAPFRRQLHSSFPAAGKFGVLFLSL